MKNYNLYDKLFWTFFHFGNRLVHDIAIDDDQFFTNSSKEFKDYEVKFDPVCQSKSTDPFKWAIKLLK